MSSVMRGFANERVKLLVQLFGAALVTFQKVADLAAPFVNDEKVGAHEDAVNLLSRRVVLPFP
jgi:hypothetical protein